MQYASLGIGLRQLCSVRDSTSYRRQVMLLSDGSVTRHLQLLTGFSVSVDCLQMENIGAASDQPPASARTLRGPLVQRQVFDILFACLPLLQVCGGRLECMALHSDGAALQSRSQLSGNDITSRR